MIRYKFVVLSTPLSTDPALRFAQRIAKLDQDIAFAQLRAAHTEKKTGRSTIAPAGQPSPTCDASRSSNQNHVA